MQPSLLRTLRRALPCVALVACGRSPASADAPLTVFAAGSLARPLRAALDSIAATGGPVAQVELMGSREMIRAVVSLRRTPDLLVTADADELERSLIPGHVTSATTFARNRVVLALSKRTAGGDTITSANWADVLATGTLKVARTDPARAPLGYRTQMVWKLAEVELRRGGLAAKLAAASPESMVRGNESDLAALLESGDADAAWCYESLARALGLHYVTLGDRVDLGAEDQAELYNVVRMRVAGSEPGDTTEVAGSPIRYSIAVANGSVDPVRATILRDRLLDAASRRIMRRTGLDVLDSARVMTAGSTVNITR